MSDEHVSRRDFLKIAGIAGFASLVAGPAACAQSNDDEPPKNAENAKGEKVPKRIFGKTGVPVSMLSLGGMFDIPSNQLMLKKALDFGVTYWDTASVYGGGKSEEGIGKFFGKNPAARQEVFLVTKSRLRGAEGLTSQLEQSLKKMKTDYVDLYFVHGISSIKEMDEETKAWAQKAKAQKKIKYFGFSTHSNMEDCLLGAAKLDWIDGIMMTYNYRNMNSPKMAEAVQACQKAGIGLTAMKTQASRFFGGDSEAEEKLLERFLKRGFTDKQAKLLAVWENKSIACICSQMPNLTILLANVAAALDRPKLSALDKKRLQEYAQETASSYCAGCTSICESALAGQVPVGDVMRYMMYCHSYAEKEFANELHGSIPKETLERMASLDYREAEKRCPQRLPIAQVMKEASSLLMA